MTTTIEIPAAVLNGDTSKTGMRQLLTMLRALMPVLDNIKTTVENSSARIPKATEQLSTVTQATENATMEILNLVDDIGRRIGGTEERLRSIEEDLEKKQRSIMALMRLVGTLPAEARNLLQQGEQDWKTLSDLTVPIALLADVRSNLTSMHSITMDIAMALQVQDITSQQIESVRHQIESIRTQLAFVVGQYEGRDDEAPEAVPVTKAFDAEAEYSRDGSRQAEADDIIAQFTRNASVAGR